MYGQGESMLTDYINAAMHHARYEILEDGTYYGEIPGLQGVYADEPTLEGTRAELQSALEDWLLFRLVNGFPIPPMDDITLATTKVA